MFYLATVTKSSSSFNDDLLLVTIANHTRKTVLCVLSYNLNIIPFANNP